MTIVLSWRGWSCRPSPRSIIKGAGNSSFTGPVSSANSSLLSKTSTGASSLTINDTTFAGGNQDGSLIDIAGGTGTNVFERVLIERGYATGNIITTSSTGYIAVRSSTINGTHADGEDCNSHIIEKINAGAIYLGNNTF